VQCIISMPLAQRFDTKALFVNLEVLKMASSSIFEGEKDNVRDNPRLVY